MTRPGDAASSQLRCFGLGHQLVGLDQGDLGQAAEVGLEAPDPLLGVEHRVVVPVGGLQLHGQAVRDDLVAGAPGVDTGAGAQHDAGEVGADDVVRQVVPLGQRGEPAVALQEPEGRHRLEDRGPHGVVVDGGGHHGHQRLTGAELGHRHVVDVQRLAGVLLLAVEAGEHLGLVLVHGHRAVGLGDGQARRSRRWWCQARGLRPGFRSRGASGEARARGERLLRERRGWCRGGAVGSAGVAPLPSPLRGSQSRRPRCLAALGERSAQQQLGSACDAGIRADSRGVAGWDSRRAWVRSTPAARTPSTYDTACQATRH